MPLRRPRQDVLVDSFDDGKQEAYFTNANGYRIYCKYWSRNVLSPRGLVFMCHGAGEHCQYYAELAELITAKGLFVFSHDHQGHGLSGGDRMHINDFRHYVRDIFYHVDMVKRKYPNIPVFIIGHSMGGCISILSGLDRPDYFTGIVLISPVVTPDPDNVGPIRIFFGKLAARVIPQFPVLWIKDNDISRDKAICQQHKDDPLSYHGGLKARWSLCLLKSVLEITDKMDTISWPFLVMHGDCDKVVNCKGSEELYRRAVSEDKTIKIYPGCYHQPHWDIEPVITQCRQDIVNWIINRLPKISDSNYDF